MGHFVLDGEPLVLDLLNTRVFEGGAPRELLAGPHELRAWVARHSEELPELPEADAAAAVVPVVRLREAVRDVLAAVRAGSRPSAEAVATLNEFAASRPAAVVLEPTDAGVRRSAVRQGPPPERLLAALSDAAIGFVASPSAAAVRECDGPGCVLLFLPAHPARRWCSSRTCGNRVRVARHYRQRKDHAN